jgi:hypothetical protein
MTSIILTSVAELRSIIRECLNEKTINNNESTTVVHNSDDELLTSIQQIALFLNCSTVTSQRIKNKLPPGSYFQIGRTFAIPKSLLLEVYPKLKLKGRGPKHYGKK